MKALNKNTLREITKSKSRFLSIFLICAIGVGFFSGVRASGGDMRRSADRYFDEHNLFDLRVVSTFGLTDSDVKALEELDGVESAYASKFTDVIIHDSDKEYTTRVYSALPDEINTITITDGRNIESPGEALVSMNTMREGNNNIGDVVQAEDPTGAEDFPLKYKEYTIVGTYETPMFISLTDRGSTTIGNGKLDALMLVAEEDFTQEPYTEIYVRCDETADKECYSDDYKTLRDEISDKLEELGEKRSKIRYDEVLGDVIQEIADGEEELEKAKADGEKELADALEELADAEQQIADGEQELADAKTELDDGKVQLDDGERQLADARATLDETKETLENAKKELDDGQAELDKAKQEIDDGEKQLADSKALIDEGEQQIADGKSQLSSARASLSQGRAELNQLYSAIDEMTAGKALIESQLPAVQQGYQTAQETVTGLQKAYDETEKAAPPDPVKLAELKAQLEQAIIARDTAQATLDELNNNLATINSQLPNLQATAESASKKISDGESQLSSAESLLAEKETELEEGKAEYEKGVEELENGKKEYEDGLALFNENKAKYDDGYQQYLDGEDEYNKSLAEFNEKKAEYEQGAADYENGVAELEDAKEKYEQGLADYDKGKADFEKEIADAEQEIADAKQKVADAGQAEWYIFNRENDTGYAEYESNAERIDRIALIFPIFFLLVAGLVCLTTMSRMVEEQRTQTGTLKALGYSRGAIMRHYMIYAVSAALIGGTLGAVGGCFLFPGVIIYAYSMMYAVTDIVFMFTAENLIVSIGSMTLAIALTVYFSCTKSLQETPASLMRPKAPKAGKRVFLEKIPFIWKRMNFFAKISARNIIRYKRRMIMTIVGIAGCTALSLTGFGLKNSIMDVADLQYNGIYQYSGYLAYDEDISENEMQTVYDTLTEYEPETAYTRAIIKQYDMSHENNSAKVYITAVENSDIFETFVDMHDRKTREKVSMKDGAVITEKAAALLGAKAGDEIVVKLSDSESRKVTITAVTEQYAGHYLYLSEQQFEDTFGELPAYNILYFYNNISRDDDVQSAFKEHVLENENVAAIMMNAASLNSIYDTLKILDIVVLVLIASAAALAFVVMYNLSNVNITERIREIATLKVLGFYDLEVSSYVFRESIVLSLIGAAVGLGLGQALCMFVVTTAEIDEIMFGRTIHPLSYVWAFLLTIVFSLAVNLIMTKPLKKVSMVESLKSVE